MHIKYTNLLHLSLILTVAAALSVPVVMGGCSAHARVYDPYYNDYHPWNHDEVVYYGRWENETHRDHREFRDRPAPEQKEYWDWRHSQH